MPFTYFTSVSVARLAEVAPEWVASVLAAAAREPPGCPEAPWGIPLCQADPESTKEQERTRKTGAGTDAWTHRNCSARPGLGNKL